MSKKATTKNFADVLNNIRIKYEAAERMERKAWVNWLNESLDELLSDDFFGTEGQLDPRGDQRD